MVLAEFDLKTVMLVPDQIIMNSNTELTQYFIKEWTLTYMEKGCIIIICCFQVCFIHMVLAEFDLKTVMLVPDQIIMNSDTELTQYFIQEWTLTYMKKGGSTICKLLQNIQFCR